ncbi:hypothetical protein ACHAWF_005680 [Thalassiosira exigua]
MAPRMTSHGDDAGSSPPFGALRVVRPAEEEEAPPSPSAAAPADSDDGAKALGARWVPAPTNRRARMLRKQSSGSRLLGGFGRKKGVAIAATSGSGSNGASQTIRPAVGDAASNNGSSLGTSHREEDPSEDSDCEPAFPGPRRASVASVTSEESSYDGTDADGPNELDGEGRGRGAGGRRRDPFRRSRDMVEKLGSVPSPSDLADVAAVRAAECIDVGAAASALDKERWDAIPQYAKADLVVGQFLGKGSFSDVFEVVAAAPEVEVAREEWGCDRDDLDRLVSEFRGRRSGGTVEAAESQGLRDEFLPARLAGRRVDAQARARPPRATSIEEEGDDDLDKEIDAMFGSDTDKSDNDRGIGMIDALYAPSKHKPEPAEAEKPQDFQPTAIGPGSRPGARGGLRSSVTEFRPQSVHHNGGPRRPTRRATTDLTKSTVVRCQGGNSSRDQNRTLVLAMKCLRPQIRSDAEQFLVGVEDLVHETALLASLDHPHIVKLHGRAGGCASAKSFGLSDGYFVLLDRLRNTLDDRIAGWKKTSKKGDLPKLVQVKTAVAIADALSYLHSKRIAFRDLKPANVGFDSRGVVKLFDFGFAIGLDERGPGDAPSSAGSDADGGEGERPLYDVCGTPRYMAPEVGLEQGYGASADVYSFGILLWEICALKKPFGNVKSASEFHKMVFEKGSRPKVGKHWPEVLKGLIPRCWSSFPGERPDMSHVKTMLSALERATTPNGGSRNNGLRKSSMFRRLTIS